jgi:tetratricopeptide (TPR) repeat protein
MPAADPTLHQRAITAYHAGNLALAQSLLAEALAANPDDLPTLKSYGQVLRDAGHPLQALEIFLRVLALDPKDAPACNAAGVCFQETGNPAAALEHYLRAMTIQPDLAETYNNLGVVLLHEHDLAGASEHFQQALELDPTYADAWNNVALLHRDRHEYLEAIETFRTALTLKPNSSEIEAGLGEVLSLVYDPTAEAHLRRALALAPEKAERHWNLALELLKHGRYPEGWREYDWRWRRGPRHTPPRPFPQPFWRGEQSLRDATLLVYAEQGLGDTLQMLRYLPLLAGRAARIVLEVQRPLLPLATQFAAAWPNVSVVAHGDPLPAFDLHTGFMTLPLALGTTVETVPPPLRFTPPAATRPRTANPRIGLCWTGNAAHDRDRALSLETLRPLLDVPGCTWVSLQVGRGADQVAAAGVAFEQPALRDFADTAAILDTLDLVITVDTAVVHLAASQGVPTWLLLPYVADWRWLEPTTPKPNPWYPRLRLFRQTAFPAHNDIPSLWQPVVAAAAQALRALP